MIKYLFSDFHFRHWGFKKESQEFALTTIHNYKKSIKGTSSDSKRIRRYIKRVKLHFLLN
jgi:hypothetical protein